MAPAPETPSSQAMLEPSSNTCDSFSMLKVVNLEPNAVPTIGVAPELL
jgi:hypothetical protein